MARDASDQQRAEASLRQAERRLAVLVEKTHDVITVLSKTAVIEYQSAACQRLTGFSPAELLGRNVFDLVHPDDVADLKERFGGHLVDVHRGMTSPAEARFRHKAGGWCWIEIVATNAFDDPAVKGLVVVSRGIDRRKAAEAELAGNRALLDFSLDAARIGAWDYDVADGRASLRRALPACWSAATRSRPRWRSRNWQASRIRTTWRARASRCCGTSRARRRGTRSSTGPGTTPTLTGTGSTRVAASRRAMRTDARRGSAA